MMEIKESVLFTSIPDMYRKERLGIKNNIMKKFQEGDSRYQRLKEGVAKHITIQNTETGKCFTRKITDVTFLYDWVIITWEHKK